MINRRVFGLVCAGLGLCLLLSAGAAPAMAAQTVGLFKHTPQAFPGYTLFGPAQSNVVYLMNNDGLVVHEWHPGSTPGLMGYLRGNGDLLRSARLASGPVGSSSAIEEFDWDGNLLWKYEFNLAVYQPHHDIKPLPNGNVLVTAWEFKTPAQAIAAGRNPLVAGIVWPDVILELHPTPPTATIVWEWHVWDHMVQDIDPTKSNFGVVSDHPELIDVNFGPTGQDWNHVNAVAYNADLDQIIISPRPFSEFWVVDHSTTSGQAAGHTGGNSGKGGDLLYRWGNPISYKRGTSADQKLWFQHDTQWIDTGLPGAGNILVFNNVGGTPVNASHVDEIVPPLLPNGTYAIAPGQAYGPAAPVWSYAAPSPTDFYSALISGAQRMPNGNTLIDEGLEGHFFEVTNSKQVVWDYVSPVGTAGQVFQQGSTPTLPLVFKIRRYPLDSPLFVGKDVTPGGPIELFNDDPHPAAPGSLKAGRLNVAGTSIQVRWTPDTCVPFDNNLIYGALGQVATATPLGAVCQMGTGGSYTWLGAPAGDLFFTLVGTDSTRVYESSWGQTSAGAERHGTTASFFCGATTKILAPTCP